MDFTSSYGISEKKEKIKSVFGSGGWAWILGWSCVLRELGNRHTSMQVLCHEYRDVTGVNKGTDIRTHRDNI